MRNGRAYSAGSTISITENSPVVYRQLALHVPLAVAEAVCRVFAGQRLRGVGSCLNPCDLAVSLLSAIMAT